MKGRSDGKRPPRYSSYHQDLAVALCLRSYGVCPFGCAKDGAWNCQDHVTRGRCEPGRKTAALAEQLESCRPPFGAKGHFDGVPVADYATAMNEVCGMGAAR